MILTKRQQEIIRHARSAGSVRINELAADMGVSLETIRRDIRPLVEGGTLVKWHGAVGIASADVEAPFERRLRENADEKRRVARCVAAMIGDGDSVMMDTGTTTSILARELLAKRGLTIVTNSSDVARVLATVNANRVYMAGGELHGDNGAAFGRSAIDFIANFKVRFSVISIAAVSARTGLMDYQLGEAEFARAVLACGEQKLVITDHTKFLKTALVKVCDIGEIDMLVTDKEPPADIVEALQHAGRRLVLADC